MYNPKDNEPKYGSRGGFNRHLVGFTGFEPQIRFERLLKIFCKAEHELQYLWPQNEPQTELYEFTKVHLSELINHYKDVLPKT